MSKKTPPSTVETAEFSQVINATSEEESQRFGEEEAIRILEEVQENAGQISELTEEEEKLVKEFFASLLTIVKPFSETFEISVKSLPQEYEIRIDRAYLHITGQLALVDKTGKAEIVDLKERKNYTLLVDITGEIMLKVKTVINSYKAKTKKRVEFLMPITKELQKVAKLFRET